MNDIHSIVMRSPWLWLVGVRVTYLWAELLLFTSADITVTSQAHSHQIRGHVYIVDKNHLYIRKFSYDGGGSLDAYFWVDYTDTLELQTNLHEVKFGVKRLFSIVGLKILHYDYIMKTDLCFQL